MLKVKYWDGGGLAGICISNDDGDFGNGDNPAVQEWYENGQEKKREYWNSDHRGCFLHHLEKPARQEWDEAGNLIVDEYYFHGVQVAKADVVDIVDVEIFNAFDNARTIKMLPRREAELLESRSLKGQWEVKLLPRLK